MSLEQLVEISNYYGIDEEIVLMGGGNTSYKDNDFLYVKASGTTLKTITAEGFVKMNRAKLTKVWSKTYSEDFDMREEEVLTDLLAARETTAMRPSVETILHDLFPQKFVVHTHPTLVNALTCAKNGETWAKKLFGNDLLWLPPLMPGYVLAKEVKDILANYKENHLKDANVLFLENHGIFAAADSIDEIKTLMNNILEKIAGQIDKSGSENEIKLLLSIGWDKFSEKYGIFTPDHYVYRGNELLFADSVKIAVYAKKFGGCRAMPGWLTKFIENWEAEKYRTAVSGK